VSGSNPNQPIRRANQTQQTWKIQKSHIPESHTRENQSKNSVLARRASAPSVPEVA